MKLVVGVVLSLHNSDGLFILSENFFFLGVKQLLFLHRHGHLPLPLPLLILLPFNIPLLDILYKIIVDQRGPLLLVLVFLHYCILHKPPSRPSQRLKPFHILEGILLFRVIWQIVYLL